MTSLFQRYNSVAVATFEAYWELKLLSDVEATLPRKSDVVRSMWEEVVNLTSKFQRCNNVVNTTFMVYLDMNLLSNTEATLEQHCNFYVATSVSIQRVLLVRRCDLTTNIVATFYVGWVTYFSLQYNWKNQINCFLWVMASWYFSFHI